MQTIAMQLELVLITYHATHILLSITESQNAHQQVIDTAMDLWSLYRHSDFDCPCVSSYFLTWLLGPKRMANIYEQQFFSH